MCIFRGRNIATHLESIPLAAKCQSIAFKEHVVYNLTDAHMSLIQFLAFSVWVLLIRLPVLLYVKSVQIKMYLCIKEQKVFLHK